MGDTLGFAEKIRELLPVLHSGPASRELEVWAERKDSFLQKFGGKERFLNYVETLANKALAEDKLGEAARLKNSLARIIYLEGDYPRAIQLYQDAFELAKLENDSTMMGWNLIGQVGAYVVFKNFDQALTQYGKAEEIVLGLNQREQLANLWMAKSALTLFKGSVDSALYFNEQAYRLAQEAQLTEFEKHTLSNLSYQYISRGDFEMAIQLLTAPEVSAGNQMTIHNALVNFNLFEAYTGLRKYDQAYGHLMKGCAVADSISFAFGSSFCYKSLSEHYERSGQSGKALTAFKTYHLLNEEQMGLEAQKEIRSLEAKQEVREKDWEIERLLLVERRQSEALAKRKRTTFYSMIGLLVIFGIIFVLYSAQSRVKLANKSREVAETRVRLLKSQMNPHFLFNSITGIQNFILKSEKIGAYNYLGKFADLLRVIAGASTTGSIELGKEIDLIETYLELEVLRYRDEFSFEVSAAEELRRSESGIPSMMIQPVVENAIQHGLSGIDYPGKLLVSVEAFKDGVVCIVRDNGKGRAAARKIAARQKKQNLSISTRNLEETLLHLQKLGYANAEIATEDLYLPNGSAAGTKVALYLPFLK